MAIAAKKISISLCPFYRLFPQFFSAHLISSSQTLEHSIRVVVEAKAYQQIPDILNGSKESYQNPNPFSFLSTFSQCHRTQIIDEILQSFIPLKPRSRPQVAYSCLISYILQIPNPLPLAFAILQRTLRSGCVPFPQTHLLLTKAWLDRRHQSQSIQAILLEMLSIGYHPDSGTCNYLISSLCSVDQINEAVKVLKAMNGAGCIPDLESYGAIIGAMCAVKRTTDAAATMKEMVANVGLMPRQETVVRVVAALRANKESWRAVEMVEFLEKKGFHPGFESYELVVEGCLECGELVLAGKVVMAMTGRGFIPYIKVRRKVVEGLVHAGEWKLAYALRHRFSELKS